jgi:hypothetical protein
MMNLKDRIFGLAQTFKLHHLLLIALTALYTGWIIFVGSSLPMIGDLGYNAGRGDPRGRESHGS